MKKALLSLALAAVTQLGAWAQGYTFSQTTGTYADLTAPTVLSTSGWDEDTYTLPMPFPFTVNGNTVTNLEIDDNGYVFFETLTNVGWMDVMYSDLLEALTGTSTVSYAVTGTAGSRILKIEWRNASFYDGTASEFTNMQLWMHEGTNNIDMRYGPSNIVSIADIFGPAGGPDVGIVTEVDTAAKTLNAIYLQGNASAPTATIITNGQFYPSLSSVPSPNTVYTFSASAVSGISKNLNNAAISLFPNPATDLITVKGLAASKTAASVKVMDVLGKVVLTEKLNASNQVNISKLPKGTYFMEVTNGTERFGKQVVKQ